MKTRIGVLTSGGDCPGLNAVLRGVVNRLRLVPPHGEIVQTARDVDISFGD